MKQTSIYSDFPMESFSMKNTQALDALLAAGLASADTQREAETVNSMTEEDWGEIWQCADLHQIWSVIYRGIAGFPDAQVPDEILRKLKAASESLAYQYFYLLSFTTYILEIFRKENIPCYVLKGIGLCSLYPSEDMRKLADADIYVPDRKEFQRACTLLEMQGFQPEKGFAEFHSGYTKEVNGRSCLLELHWRPCEKLADSGAERAVRKIFGELEYEPEIYTVSGMKVPVLPATENALQLLLHMFQHFVHEGFGLRMLCDWRIFWEKKGDQTDLQKFLSYLKETKLEGFAWTVTQICTQHMGLKREYVPWVKKIDSSRYAESDKMLYCDIMMGGEFGKGDSSRMVIFRNGSPFFSACIEIHKAMKFRFPKLKKYVLLWPFLWAATISVFLKNNKRLNRGKTEDIIKSARIRKVLLERMQVSEHRGN